MNTLVTRMQDRAETLLYGRSNMCCETCGVTVRPSRAVWRGSRAFCSASHEHADLDAVVLTSSLFLARTTGDARVPMAAGFITS